MLAKCGGTELSIPPFMGQMQMNLCEFKAVCVSACMHARGRWGKMAQPVKVLAM